MLTLDIEQITKITKKMDEEKAEQIEIVDLKSRAAHLDYVISATVLSPRHGASLSKSIISYVKTHCKIKPLKSISDHWIVIDCGNVMFHLFSEPARKYYDITSMWSKEESNSQDKIKFDD